MKQQFKITIISGTNRPGSYSKKVSENVKAMIGQLGCSATLLDLSLLPREIFYNESYSEKPEAFAEWQEWVSNSDALLFCVPEYNGGIPGILKYFMDMLAYPDSLKHKPIMLLGLSAGSSGAVNALEELCLLLNFQKAKVFDYAVSIPQCKNMITESGTMDSGLFGRIIGTISDFIRYCKQCNFPEGSSILYNFST